MKTEYSIFNVANISLIFLTGLQIIRPIMVRFAHKIAASYGTKFHSTSAVCITELIKIALCFILLCCKKPSKSSKTLYDSLIVNKYESLKICVPAIIYFAQANMYYIALDKLNASVFTITYQLRILTVAILAVIILKKVFTLIQWGALFICLAGVISVNALKFDGNGHLYPETMDQLIGIGLVLTMCWMSAFAGIYLEKIFKNSSDDLWIQNIHLSIATLVITFICIIYRYITVENYDFFQGWNYWNWIISVASAISGILVATVLKYADNIRKSFCQSFAICGTSFLSIALGDSLFTVGLAVGTVLVVISTVVYTLGGKKKKIMNEKEVEDVEKNAISDNLDTLVSSKRSKENEQNPMLVVVQPEEDGA